MKWIFWRLVVVTGICFFANGVDYFYDLYGMPRKDVAEFYNTRLNAEKGYHNDQFYLGVCYHIGRGVKKDINKAVLWYKKAADQGNSNGQINLGYCYYVGQGVEQNLRLAADLFQKSASQGNHYGQNMLGECYENGHGVQKNISYAVDLYRKAAAKGHENAKNNLKRLGY